ncbi:hypothetical protein [Acidihalobacter ferrooxydans]|uniref:Uncharacterized protein n=1 Tax=Acidihalobacter ferrooxydans TaxID=1765967 RepID=A0A1P8UJQ8_9GAMM|nr:hypothetical protein [Acidihalobacter ferrooxydans]APZ44056.1 hypothetical protein BW247_13920 [Acidihalobacter ferrooxydans]
MAQRIEGRLIIDLMRGCLSEVSGVLKNMRGELSEQDPERMVLRNGLLFSLDMNLAAIHMLGMKLMEAEATAAVELENAEKVIIGLCGSFMDAPLARLIDDALEGFAVTDERVQGELATGGTGGMRLQ